MIRRVGVLFIAVGVASVGYGMGLCDYRVPVTESLQGKVSFFYQHVDDPALSGIALSAGWLEFDARRQHDSATEGFTLAGKGQLRFRNLGLVQATLGGSAAVRQYLPGPLSLFTFGGVEAALDTTNPQPRAEAQAGLGYGRFFNVTPLAKALQIDAMLLARGVIPSALSEDVLLAVAGVIGGEGTPAERAEHVVAVVEQTLRDQSLPRTLDAATGLAIEEVIAQAGRERFCGWTVHAGMAYEILDPQGGSRDLLFALAVDAAVAPEPSSQLLLRTRISGPYWITEQYTLSLDVTFDVRVNDSVSFSTRYALFLDKPLGQVPAGMQSATFQLELTLGALGVVLQMEFAKLAESPAWRQSILITATAYLW